jgi:3-isopropylmalate/(R)-2-methylmalate dehydratase small subunit
LARFLDLYDVNTDYIISSSRKRSTIDPKALAQYLFEGIDPRFAASVQPGDIIVAGKNFGCGSAMEVAVTVIQAAGIRAVVAKSFARSFYRNAINNGLLVIERDTAGIQEGTEVKFESSALPPVLASILEHGGLVGYLRSGGSWTSPA